MIPDLKTDWKLTKVHSDVADRWRAARREIYNKYKLQMAVTDGMRSFTDQNELFSRGRTNDQKGNWEITDRKKIITYEKAGESLHQYGLAIDCCFVGSDPYLNKLPEMEGERLWNLCGIELKNQGLIWGGDWPIPEMDRPHCELTYGMTIHQIQIIYEDKGLGALWERCKQILYCGSELI